MLDGYGERMCSLKTKQKTWESMSAEERDALVAEKIMGWTDIRLTFPEGRAAITPYPPSGRSPSGYSKLPRFTTSLPAAFEVVEKMKDHYIDIERCPWESEKAVEKEAVGAWIVFVITPGAPYKNVEAIAETLPEAICLAALRAKGIEV